MPDNPNLTESDAVLYGFCLTCGVARTVRRTVDATGSTLDLICSADATHGPENDPFHNRLCTCPSERGRFGSHTVTCPAAVAQRIDLDNERRASNSPGSGSES